MDLLRTPDYILRKVRNHDKVTISLVFIFMVGLLPVVQTLWFVDVFILNLLHAVDHFYTLKDWKKCGKELCFGSMYLLATRCGNVGATLLCGAGVAVAWIATCRTDGHPCLDWIFPPCLLIFGSRFVVEWAPAAIVCAASFKTTVVFMFIYPNKTLADALLIFCFISLHLVFVKEDYNIHYLVLSYAFSFFWMLLKQKRRKIKKK